jgi:murein DD-endopeptidase MepM/ murein hydrolase activator NlpD
MILSPLENASLLKREWIQQRPIITQSFGKRPDVYKQFGMKGHNGMDFRAKVGTPVYASFDGEVQVRNSKDKGYGLHIKLRSSYRARESVYGHLSRVVVKSGDRINIGDLLGFTGNTGFSSGPHLHWGLRHLVPRAGDVFKWKVKDHNNGYYGWIDPAQWTITYKGTFKSYSLN